MTISASQQYGGSAQQGEDSLQWHRFCSQSGPFYIKETRRTVILSREEDATERGFARLEKRGEKEPA